MGWATWPLLVALALAPWQGKAGVCYPNGTLPCPGASGGACYCQRGDLCWLCGSGDSCDGSLVFQCGRPGVFALVGTIASCIAIGCLAFCCICTFWYHRHRAKAFRRHGGPREGIALHLTDPTLPVGVPVECPPSPAPSTTNGSDVLPYPAEAEGRSGLYCGPLVRSASQSSLGSSAGLPRPPATSPAAFDSPLRAQEP